MSSTPIDDFYRGDSLDIRVTLAVNGVPDALAGATLQVAVRALGGTATPLILKSVTVPAGVDADAGRAVISLTPTDTSAVPPGQYDLYLLRIRSSDRWTFHHQAVKVLAGVA